jgi:hypothetical protein
MVDGMPAWYPTAMHRSGLETCFPMRFANGVPAQQKTA